MNDDDDGEDDRRRSAAIGGLVVALVIVAGGVWLATKLIDDVRYERCAEARHHNCDNINLRMPAR
jgi:hypothetical protein